MVVPGALALRGRVIGLLGGSFNPAHAGHLHISTLALNLLRLDQVWWLVSPQNPLKSKADMAPLTKRFGHARALAAASPTIRVTKLETVLRTRFTINTVTRLQASLPATRFIWLMGADNLRELPHWRRWPELFQRLPIAVLSRGTHDLPALAGAAAKRFHRHRLPASAAANLAHTPPPAWVFLPIRRHPASATAIRATKIRP